MHHVAVNLHYEPGDSGLTWLLDSVRTVNISHLHLPVGKGLAPGNQTFNGRLPPLPPHKPAHYSKVQIAFELSVWGIGSALNVTMEADRCDFFNDGAPLCAQTDTWTSVTKKINSTEWRTFFGIFASRKEGGFEVDFELQWKDQQDQQKQEQ